MLNLVYLNERTVRILYRDVEKITLLDSSLTRAKSITLYDGTEIDLYSKLTFSLPTGIQNMGDKDRTISMQINYIRKNDTGMDLSETELNKTSEYILPLLGLTKSDVLYDKYLLNAYIKSEKLGIPDNNIILVYRNVDSNYFRTKLIGTLENVYFFKRFTHPEYDESYVIFYKNIERHKEEIDKILKGNYRALTMLTKNQIRDFHVLTKNDTRYKQLYDFPEMRLQMEKHLNTGIPQNMSLISKPVLEEETLQID
jgi:hypothetical protein